MQHHSTIRMNKQLSHGLILINLTDAILNAIINQGKIIHAGQLHYTEFRKSKI